MAALEDYYITLEGHGWELERERERGREREGERERVIARKASAASRAAPSAAELAPSSGRLLLRALLLAPIIFLL